MKWLVLSSAVLSCLSNMFSMIGYECIALAGENYKLRRRCIRFGGFLIFLSGILLITGIHELDVLVLGLGPFWSVDPWLGLGCDV